MRNVIPERQSFFRVGPWNPHRIAPWVAGALLAQVTAMSALVLDRLHAGEAAAPERLPLAKRLELGVVAIEARGGGDQVLCLG